MTLLLSRLSKFVHAALKAHEAISAESLQSHKVAEKEAPQYSAPTMSQNNIYCMSCRVVRLKNAVSNFKSAWRDFWENVGVSVEYLYRHCMWDSVCRNKATRRNKYKTQIANKSMDVKKGYRKYQDISVDNMSSGSKETHVLFLYFWCYKEPAPVQWYNNHD